MNITLITVGKIKEKFYRDAVEEFVKRLGRYCKIKIVEVADENTPNNAPEAIEEQIKNKEGERILKYISDSMYVIALAIEGKECSSVKFAERLERLGVEGNSDICFVIGGSLGLSKDVYKRADELLSFSPMTFPHQLMRVILLEQIYRCFRIIHNEPYHK
ncbi:MAG: 23S rRNA (pseudouridine(1915)-N(3))-methyltransferase RlmH [Lachnospiraceae bacterium]|nr:23S rRNA (pseudouridine(1915)-N(3))-methyltransferase RlmH [Lachnospiraceae bacterium]